jgi:hypothetical protein
LNSGEPGTYDAGFRGGEIMGSRSRFVRAALLFAVIASGGARAQDPIAVVLMTGFNPGANPGMAALNAKLQSVFGGGAPLPPFSSQVFAYTNQSGAAAFLAAAGPNAKRVLVGHSWGASSNFTLAQNVLGPMGLDVALQVSVDWVSQTNPFSATTPTVPAQILLAYNYHQTSTQILEPVPSHTIIGAARNLNMEGVFADGSIVHTSIDDDARVHELVVARIRDLFTAAPFPGTGEHADLFCRHDVLNVPCNPGAGIAIAGVLAEHALQPLAAGEWVTLRTLSPEGDFSNSPFGVLGEVFTTGSAPVSALPGVASSLNPSALLMLTPGAVQTWPFSLALLPPAGADFTFCWPAGLTGVSVLVQTVIVDAGAQNGVYATSLGIELRGT